MLRTPDTPPLTAQQYPSKPKGTGPTNANPRTGPITDRSTTAIMADTITPALASTVTDPADALDEARAAIAAALAQASGGPTRNPMPRVRVSCAVDDLADALVHGETVHDEIHPHSEARLRLFIVTAEAFIRDRAAEAEQTGHDPRDARRIAAVTLHAITRALGGDAR